MNDVLEIISALDGEARRAGFVSDIESGQDRRRALRHFYGALTFAASDEWAVDPYEVDWLRVFTPIERALWHDIRASDAVLYPQFPVGPYFVDFGNPVAKVAVECDGKFHSQQVQADAKRQADIERQGWSVYRIGGRDCFDGGSLTRDEHGTERIDESAGARLLREICGRHRISRARSA